MKVSQHWVSGKRPDGATRLLDLCEYILAADYCVRVWSDDPKLRHQAACLKALDKLEYDQREISPTRIQQHLVNIFTGLEVQLTNTGALLEMARKRDLGQAAERLESIFDVGDEKNEDEG